MQFNANPDTYGLGKPQGVTEKGLERGDVYSHGDGLTNMDALSIQKFKLGLIDKLPEE